MYVLTLSRTGGSGTGELLDFLAPGKAESVVAGPRVAAFPILRVARWSNRRDGQKKTPRAFEALGVLGLDGFKRDSGGLRSLALRSGRWL
jgi:hypothetical protein